ncbi:MAG: SMP-30/gluconolactonase/LRE family protein [Labilithrix sp.]|nr:SMP-30/gluconolactonase/LRE family protein [Labilithrix sp.]
MSSHRRRLALVFAALPLVFYAYACGDDPTSPSAEEEDGGGRDGGGTTDEDTGNGKVDSGDIDSGKSEDAGDGGEAEPECVGNPLVPDGGSPDGGVTVAFANLRAIGTGQFLDGPQFIDDGSDGGAIVYSEVTSQTIVRNGPDGGARVVLRATGNNNLPIGNAAAGGFIYTTLARFPGPGGGVLRMLLDGGAPTGFDGGGASSPNDAVGSSKGFVYFTDPAFQGGGASTGVYRLAPDGGVTSITTFAGVGTNQADGIALTADGSTLYVGFFDARRITRYAVDANGVAANPQVLTFTPADNPTGIAVDVAGNLWIAENGNGVDGRIEVVSPAGKKWGEIPFPDSRPTGIAFGGKDNKTAYITTERGDDPGTLYVLPIRCAGVR